MIKHLVSIPLALAAICSAAYGATTCIHNQTPVFVIKKSVTPTSVSSNAANMTFELRFDYDLMPGDSASNKLSGMATCNEITTDTSGGNASQGSANTHLRASNADVGTYCWCQLTGPVTSWWVYNKKYSDDDACASGCASDCANAIKNNTNNFLTNGIYRAIW
ncbi:MAG: hypothetical protein K2M34_04435 [Alphaproteobacteria bacterium]|nr:hypothetical protein [Alphaproteobacteria bacterium]